MRRASSMPFLTTPDENVTEGAQEESPKIQYPNLKKKKRSAESGKAKEKYAHLAMRGKNPLGYFSPKKKKGKQPQMEEEEEEEGEEEEEVVDDKACKDKMKAGAQPRIRKSGAAKSGSKKKKKKLWNKRSKESCDDEEEGGKGSKDKVADGLRRKKTSKNVKRNFFGSGKKNKKAMLCRLSIESVEENEEKGSKDKMKEATSKSLGGSGSRRKSGSQRIRIKDDNRTKETFEDDEGKKPRKKDSPRRSGVSGKNMKIDSKHVDDSDDEEKVVCNENPKGKPEGPVTNKREKANAFINDCLDRGAAQIYDEYSTVPMLLLTPEEVSAQMLPPNKKKCRYPTDCWCIDSSRVKLSGEPPADFIHANFVRSGKDPKRFVLSQGPMENTAADMWRMIFEHDIFWIVMLCCCVEKGKDKCFAYFPDKEGERKDFGDFSVICKETDFHNVPEADCVLRVFSIRKGETVKKVSHLQWRDWPDNLVPESVAAPAGFIQWIRMTRDPILVHCSAGMGRSGALVLMMRLLENISLRGPRCTPFNILQEMRSDRSCAVQSPLQYLYAHRVVLQYFHSKNFIKGSMKDRYEQFCQEYDVLYWTGMEAKTQDEDGVELKPIELY